MAKRGRLLLLALAALGTALGSHWLITRAAQSTFAPLVQGVFLAQHAGVHGALALWFATTLRRGHQPLISTLAQRVHGHLTPAMAHYTRQVTLAWVLYFAAMAAVSLGLYFGGQLHAWSLLVNAITPVATLAMFVGEYGLRYRLHPEFERVGFTAAARAWRLHQADRRSRP
ncbi:hypothetical protein [Sphaerotilus sp.]|jgi:uncharacterized membrane protein|uniref:hypothetical protein n=1 Tax=Sphaerotilus sp. TaxID=2093942 RepID=UPI00286EA346|nr:hypothetical protein [Sphaerotilus sp.]